MHVILSSILRIGSCLLLMTSAQAGWQDMLEGATKEFTGIIPPSTTSTSALSEQEVIEGLKAALLNGTEVAITQLGQEGGFLENPQVRIPLPSALQPIAEGARNMGLGVLVEDFQTTMNRAAEAAVPAASPVFKEAITSMTVKDALDILQGPDDAATQYFRRKSEGQLQEEMLPIVKQETNRFGVTSAYKKLLANAGPVGTFLGPGVVDPDQYVTSKALDGLFLLIAAEEKRIREEPIARTSDILKKVFGSVSGE